MNAEAQEKLHGRALCDSVYNFLAGTKSTPKKIPLVAEGTNNFPYNIITTFPEISLPESQSAEERNAFVIAFTLEDAYEHRNILTELIQSLYESDRNYKLDFLFSYGDNDIHAGRISGTENFASKYDNTEDVATICISFIDENKTNITPGGSGEIAPKWLTFYAAKSLIESQIQFEINGGAFLSLYRTNTIIADARTSSFLEKGIPSLGLSFSNNENSEKILSALKTLISLYTAAETTEWERHYVPVKFAGNFFLIGENSVVISFIAIAFMSFAFLIFASLIDEKRKSTIGDSVRILYALIPTLTISIAALQISQPLVQFVSSILDISIFVSFAIKIAVSFVAVIFLFDFSSRFLGRLSEIQYWFLLSFVAIINFFMFSLIDISFFFTFAFEISIIYFSRTLHKPIPLFIMFFAITLPFLPLVYQIAKFTNMGTIREILYAAPVYNFLIGMILLPLQLQWLRVIISMYGEQNMRPSREKHTVRRHLFMLLLPFVSVCIIMAAVSVITNSVRLFFTNDRQEKIQYVTDDFPQITSTDRIFFGETFRTLNVNLGDQAFSCEITLEGVTALPIIYSENEYVNNASNMTSRFVIPSWPPAQLSFRYIAGGETISTVTVVARYYDNDTTVIKTSEQIITGDQKRSFR